MSNPDLPLTPAIDTLRPPPPARRWSKARILGVVLLSFWIAAGLSMIYYLFSAFTWAFYDRYAMKFVNGIWVTFQIVGISLVLGALLSIPVALGRLSKNKLIGAMAFGYSYLMRGTPLLAQTYLVYYGLGSFHQELQSIGLWWFFREAFNCVILIFTLNTAAYQAEILRGAIENVSKHQTEAGDALGLSKMVIFWKIILPQALITALRPYGNEIILMIKGSAIASLVTVFDLMGETRRAYSRSFDFQTYVWAAIMYLSVVETLRRLWNRFEAYLTRHLERDSD